jgi:hypothetical protein
MKARRLTIQHSNLSWVVFIAWMRARDARSISSCFSQPDESKRAEKMLEPAIPSLFRLG